jgi:transposase IS4-like protein
MGRLRPPRLPDVGLGALTRWCPPGLVDRAIEKCGRRERRRRLLPARTVVYFELARCLYQGEGYASVYEHLLPADDELDLCLAQRGFRVPNKSSLCKARIRLGAKVMEEVFHQVRGPVGTEESCPTAFWRGLRLEAFDGTVLDVADSRANTAEFTRPAGGAGPGGYPQARIVILVECGTHTVIDAAIGGRRQGETTLAMGLACASGPGTLVLADRNMPGVPLWLAFRRTGAHLLWRLKQPTGHCQVVCWSGFPEQSWAGWGGCGAVVRRPPGPVR